MYILKNRSGHKITITLSTKDNVKEDYTLLNNQNLSIAKFKGGTLSATFVMNIQTIGETKPILFVKSKTKTSNVNVYNIPETFDSLKIIKVE